MIAAIKALNKPIPTEIRKPTQTSSVSRFKAGVPSYMIEKAIIVHVIK